MFEVSENIFLPYFRCRTAMMPKRCAQFMFLIQQTGGNTQSGCFTFVTGDVLLVALVYFYVIATIAVPAGEENLHFRLVI